MSNFENAVQQGIHMKQFIRSRTAMFRRMTRRLLAHFLPSTMTMW